MDVIKFHYQDYKKYRISSIFEKNFKLFFLFIHNQTDDSILIKKELKKCKEEFLRLFKEILGEQIEPITSKKFDEFLNLVYNKFPPIISFLGYSGVGKTTITNLIRSKDIPILQDSRISGEISTLKIGGLNFLIRDFNGQEEIGFLWNNFIKGSDVLIIVTNSTLENVEKSKFFLKKIEEVDLHAYTLVLANKQDLEDALESTQIENIIGLKTIPITATKQENRDELIQSIINVLDMYDEFQPLLILNVERQNLIKEFEEALMCVDIEKAESIYKEIIHTCLKLGENPAKMEFYRKYQEIKTKLKKFETPKEAPSSDITPVRRGISELENLLKILLTNYMNNVKNVLAVIISDRDGFVITSESRKDIEDESVLGAIAVMVDSYIERIKKEFSNESSFFNITTIRDKKFAYCSNGPKSILLTITDLATTDTELRIFSKHVAEKVELLLEGNENVSLEIPEIIRIIAKTKDGKIPVGDYSLKLILIGDFAAGKTSLITRFVQNLFKEDYQSTVGVDISQKVIKLGKDTKIKFIIWDIGGQMPKMAPYRKKFYEGANCAFIVIDRTRPDGLETIEKWLFELKSYIKEEISIILVGNKSDLVDEIFISEEDIRIVANRFSFNYIITSAKTGESVNNSFLNIAYQFIATIL
ncbi:MAG: GTP-binding protein [Promethearchaeota archaeon]|nr:MAG: GTP-binding protein [Candidatus Lokiarchaeota archaeon]